MSTAITPKTNDVLFGRGHAITVHPGNQLLLSMVLAQKQNFMQSKRLHKRKIACDIVNDIQKLGGRFLTEGPNGGSGESNVALSISEKIWFCVDREKAVSKVMFRLGENDKGFGRAQTQIKQGYNNFPQQSLQNNARVVGSTNLDALTGCCSQNIQLGFVTPSVDMGGDNAATESAEDTASILRRVNVQLDAQQNTINAEQKTIIGYSPTQPRACIPLSGQVDATILQPTSTNLEIAECLVPSNHLDDLSFDQSLLRLDPPISLNKPARSLYDTLSDTKITKAFGEQVDKSCGGRVLSVESGARKRLFYWQYANNTTANFPMSVLGFLKLGCLTNRTILLQLKKGEANTQADQRKRTLENAARLALLLTKLFVDCLPETDLSSVKLDDFSINLERDPTVENMLKSRLKPDTNNWTLLQIDFAFPTRVKVPRKYDEPEAMRILGNLLYSIFSQGKSPPSDLMATTALPLHKPTADFNRRSSKTSRMAERSLLSKLIGSNAFPVSICTLISDMVDTGSNGQFSCPFKSFDAIIQELEQMIYQPETFLHDPCSPWGVPLQPKFGETYHGRDREIANLKRVIIQMEKSLNQPKLGLNNSGCLDAIFVSGIAGSGKSHLIQAVRETLSSKWIVAKAKFERGKEHTSRTIVSSMFDQLIFSLVRMKENGNPSDAAQSQQVSNSILNTIGYDSLSSLVDFLPSLASLFDRLSADTTMQMKAEDNEFSLICAITNIIKVLLESDWLIMICCDDLQWADRSSLSMICEVLVSVGSYKLVCSQCLFVGLFRHDEIDDNHPYTIQLSYLELMTSHINTTKIELSTLSKKDICRMLMAELHLPQRFVLHLADAVHKKTSGHAYFVVELLNSLLRKSVIVYNSQSRRYAWDRDVINMIQTGDGVAGLIASNLRALPPASQRALQIISSFGIQTDISLLKCLENFQEGIVSSLDTFVEMGILDRAGPLVIFTHDLIQKEADEIMSLADRQKLYLDIGMFLGEQANNENSARISSAAADLGDLQLADREFFAGKSMTSSLISLACDQIGSVGLDMVRDEGQRIKFATWNLQSGKQSYHQSNSHAALYYFSKGITFLGQACWHNKNEKLCLALHKGAVLASFALGMPDEVTHYAETISSKVKFEDSLEIQPIVLRSLCQSGKHQECLAKGIKLLNRLNFGIPIALTRESLMNTVAIINSLASKFSMDQIMGLCEEAVDVSVHRAVEIVDAMIASCYQSSSPFMPFIACATIQFSLHHGICHESAVAFAVFGMLKIFDRDYTEGRYWADVARAIVDKHKTTNFRPQLLMNLVIDIWFIPPRVIGQKLLHNYENATRKGSIDTAMLSLQTGWRFKLLGGEHLSLIYKSSHDRLRLLAKHSQWTAKLALLDCILLMELTGKSCDCFSFFQGSIKDLNDLRDVAKLSNDLHLLQSSHVFNVFVEYWRGNYKAAEESSHLAMSLLPASKMPNIYLIYHTFFRGLILFQLYRTCGNEQRLNDGKEMLDKMEEWYLVSSNVFKNKCLLLKAEFLSSIGEFDEALRMYARSIESAQCNGNIHELALAHELLGKYYLERKCMENSKGCFRNAHVYYTQWGAITVAEKVLREYKLELDPQALPLQNKKHARQRD